MDLWLLLNRYRLSFQRQNQCRFLQATETTMNVWLVGNTVVDDGSSYYVAQTGIRQAVVCAC